MNLHVNVTPEAEAALAAQKRNSTIAAVIVAVLGVLLLGLVFWLFKIYLPTKTTETLTVYVPHSEADDKPTKEVVKPATKSKPSPPSMASVPVLAVNVTSPISIPTVDTPFDVPAPEIGTGVGFNSGTGGSGDEAGWGDKGFTAIVDRYQKRCSKVERMARLKEMGGTVECEEAVMKSLRWIKKTQNQDGSSGQKHKVAMTGLSLLAYLGHCETPHSPEFGESVEKAIVYLVNVANKQDGRLGTDVNWHGWVYEHAIATYALAEAYTFCNQVKYEIPGLKEAVLSAGKVLINGQAPNGGWRYAFSYDAHHDDTSVTGFCLQALKACKHTGLTFPQLEKTARKGLGYIQASQNKDGQIGYDGKKHPRDTMTGAGLLCLQQWGKGKSRPARKALAHLNESVKFESYGSANIYGHYYYGQAMMEAGGDYWKQYNKQFRDELLKGQKPDGSYKVGGKTTGGAAVTEHYRTCMATLSLEVYYRFLPGTSK